MTNSGPAVDASAFCATMYALAFFEADVPTAVDVARSGTPDGSEIGPIVDNVVDWRRRHPRDWRATRGLIREEYDTDPSWTSSRVNFAATIMALLYGDGDLMRTLTIACLAGWDADNNATTSAGLLGLIAGHEQLPEAFRTASEIYYNEDVTGDVPRHQAIGEIAARTQALAEAAVLQAGGHVNDGVCFIPSR